MMDRVRFLVWAALIATLAATMPAPRADAAEPVLRVAVTTSFENSGLADLLIPQAEKALGLDIQLVVVGTGQALRLGQSGDVDAVLVHAKAAEEAFVRAGYGLRRTPIMVNDFVIVGPRGDPAKIKEAKTAREALVRIAHNRALFVSRGDDSGTHQKERALWASDERVDNKPWYRETGSGMGAALNTAAAMGAYTLSDRASWLTFQNKRDLALLFEGDPDLLNPYSYIPINPKPHPHIAAKAAAAFERWLVSKQGQDAINSYRLNGQALFVGTAN
ncbi:MAG: substrate-binding domain-containing protein [Pseudomonadota bacterium]